MLYEGLSEESPLMKVEHREKRQSHRATEGGMKIESKTGSREKGVGG